MPLVLASTSPYRRELLTRLGIAFTTASPKVDEALLADESPAAYVERLALAKAGAVAAEHPDSWLIGSDQAAVLGDEVLGKPGAVERAEQQLARCAGQTVCFFTAVALVRPNAEAQVITDVTRVKFRALSAAEIYRYIAAEQPLDCAGSFKVEALGITLFESVESHDPTALIGLPLIAVCNLLRRAGASLP